DKRYAGDNRLIGVKSSHRRSGLAPRCRFIASWGCRSSQGLGCSPIKAVRELGSERRETVRSLSVVGAGNLRGVDRMLDAHNATSMLCARYERTGLNRPLVIQLSHQWHSWVAKSGRDKR